MWTRLGNSAAALCAGIALGLAALGLAAAPAQARNNAAVLAAFDRVVAEHIYDPRALDTSAYRAFRVEFGRRAATAHGNAELVAAFRASWKGEPFSHFDLRLAEGDAAQTTAGLRSEGAGEVNAALSLLAEGVGLLTVKTFLGDAVGRQILEGVGQARARRLRVLIVDLRDNPGGSMAGVLLVQSLLPHPERIGFFAAGGWWRGHAAAPDTAQLAAMSPLARPDPAAFAADLADDGISLVELSPLPETFDGRVILLTSRPTASIAEMATAALKGAGRATVVGETTAGQMLSGEFADVAPGLQVFMPMADYHSIPLGRIEGRGVAPDIPVPADQALDRALELAKSRPPS